MRFERLKRIIALWLALVMVLGVNVIPVSAQMTPNVPDLRTEMTKSEAMNTTIDDEEIVTVVVEMESPTTLDKPEFVQNYGRQARSSASQSALQAAYREGLINDHEDLQYQISQIYPDAIFRYHYTNLLNGFAARIPYGAIEEIKALDGVLDVYVTMTYNYYIDDEVELDNSETEYISIEEYYSVYGGDGIDLEQAEKSPFATFSDDGSISQMGLKEAWAEGFTGAGKVVAVFDSGLNVNHELFQYMDPVVAEEKPDNYKTKESLLFTINENRETLNLFNKGWGSWFHGYDETGFSDQVQQEILNGEFHNNEKVPFAVDYANGDLGVSSTSSHGTHVSGISAGNMGPNKTNGVIGGAYDAQIMFFKVFDEFDAFAQESDEATFAALDDAVTLGVNTFNLSLGIKNGFTTMNTYAQAGYQRAYNRAKAAGISVAVSAGNDARDNHSQALYVRPSILPNAGTGGFSGTMFAPMTVASAQGTGYKRVYFYLTTMKLTNETGETVYTISEIRDNNPEILGNLLTGSYELINIGNGTEAEILAATGAASLQGALSGKAVLIAVNDNIVEAQANAYAAGAVACIVSNSDNRVVLMDSLQLWDTAKLPVIGKIQSAHASEVKNLLTAGKLNIAFTSVRDGQSVSASYNDSGPSSFTSWGVTEALKLKPDIMAPGGNIYSSNNGGYQSMNGTSMASPNMQGAFVLIQQAIDNKIAEGIFDVVPGTQEYSDLIDQAAASTAKVYSPYPTGNNNTGVYFSPRRQGSGMVQVDKAIKSNVILHNGNTVTYNSETGESPRTKVDLGDKLGTHFEFTFMLDNYNNASRTFNVSSVLQTDALQTNAAAGGYSLAAVTSSGSDIDPMGDAVIKVQGVKGGTVDVSSNNINRYTNGYSDASRTVITVPAKSSVEVTISVDTAAVNFDSYDEKFLNGMFLEGFVWFESDEDENVSIPFMGFRGDWTAAPIFDLADAYTERTSEILPMYHNTAMFTTSEKTNEIALGVNQFTSHVWRGYSWESGSSSTQVRTAREYFDSVRGSDNASSDFIAISPDGDGYADMAYTNFSLLRNAKAVCVVIRGADGETIKIIGPEYEFFEVRADDGNKTQQTSTTYGSKYLRDMAWDGTDNDGYTVEDGQYTYEVRALLESEYLELGDYPAADAQVLEALLNSDTVQSISMPVKVDTIGPAIKTSKVSANNTIDVIAADTSGIQALAVYYNGARVGDIVLANSFEYTYTFDLNSVAEEGINGKLPVIPELIQVQAVDFAMNVTTAGADKTVDLGGQLPKEGLDIVSVEELLKIEVVEGTDFDDIDLPETITAILSDTTEKSIEVQWDKGSYDKDILGVYTVTGELMLPENVYNPDQIAAEIKIEVVEKADVTEVEKVAINASGISNMKVGTEMELTVTINPEEASDAAITWTSSNTSILKVDENGVVQALKVGSARITATAPNGVSHTITIRVMA